MKVSACIGAAYGITRRSSSSTSGLMRYQWRVERMAGARGMLAGQFDTAEQLGVAEFSAAILANIRLHKNVLNFSVPDNLAQLCRDAAVEAKQRMTEDDGDDYE